MNMRNRILVTLAILTAGALAFGQTDLGPIVTTTQDQIGQASAPQNPPTGQCRMYFNTTSGVETWINSSGASCGPSGGGGGGNINPGTGIGQIPVWSPGSTLWLPQQKAIYDVRDWATCNTPPGTTSGNNVTSALKTMLSAIGSQQAMVRLIGTGNSSYTCLVDTISWPANVTLDFSGGGGLSLTTTIVAPGGGLVDGTAAGNYNSATNSCAVTLNVPTAGDAVALLTTYHFASGGGLNLPTDTNGDVYRLISASNADPNHYSTNTFGWVASNVPAGNVTITIPYKASPNNTCGAVAVKGLGPSVGADGAGASCANSCNTNSPMTTVASATFTAGSFLVSFGGQTTNTETCTAGSGFTQILNVGAGMSLCAQVQASAAGGAVTPTQAINSTPTSSAWMYNVMGLKPTYATQFILGTIFNPNNNQIFYNASGNGQGSVDFTGNIPLYAVYPEWWGAQASASATVNSAALQAAEHGAFGTSRTNASGLYIYNKLLYLSQNYPINAEITFYDVLNFNVACNHRLSGGITQTASNLRIIDGQSIAYGSFNECAWTGAASSTLPLIDLDYNGVTTAGDLAPQFIDFNRNLFNGNTLVATGVQIAKSGGGAQGSNIYCWNCEGESFSFSVWSVGTTSVGAANAIDIGWYGGDMEGNPQYGMFSNGGGHIFLRDTTMENGFDGIVSSVNQTGFDMFCENQIGTEPCIMDNDRSESRRLMSAGLGIIRNSYTIDQSSYPTPGTSQPVGRIMKGSVVGGDGAYYKVTVDSGTFSGAGSPSALLNASSGTSTTLTDTNVTVAGSVTNGGTGGSPVGLFVNGETMTQASTGATATLLNIPQSIATVTGSVTSGTFTANEGLTQTTTGATALLDGTVTGSNNMVMLRTAGSYDGTHTWCGNSSGACYTPSGVPTFAVASPSMLMTNPTGSPDGTHTWTGGTSGGVYTPSGAPAAQANWTTNAFAGMIVSVLSNSSPLVTNAGCVATITSNTAQTLTFSAGWKSNFNGLYCTNTDTTTTFLVEPGWNGGTVVSGGMTMVALNEKGIDGSNSGLAGRFTLENVTIPGDQVNVSTQSYVKNLQVSRPDWAPSGVVNGLASVELAQDIEVHLTEFVSEQGNTYYRNWQWPGASRAYSGPLQRNFGTTPLIFTCGFGGGSSNLCSDVWVGGRSDPFAGSDVFRNRLEIGGALGAPAVVGINQNGNDTLIAGGSSTGNGTPGGIKFGFGVSGSSGAGTNSGTFSQRITGLQGSTGPKIFMCTGSFTPGDLISTDSNGNCVDAGISQSGDYVQAATVNGCGATCTFTYPHTYSAFHSCVCSGVGGSCNVATETNSSCTINTTVSTNSFIVSGVY